MKERKPRTKEQSDLMKKTCMYYDGKTENGTHIHECMFPWNEKCEGDRHKCFKLKLHWFASLSDEKRKIMQDKYSL